MNLQNPIYQKFKKDDPLSINQSLVENLLEPWKKEIKLSKAIYNSIKEKILCGSKRKLDTDHQGLNVCKKIKYEDESNIKDKINECPNTSLAEDVVSDEVNTNVQDEE